MGAAHDDDDLLAYLQTREGARANLRTLGVICRLRRELGHALTHAQYARLQLILETHEAGGDVSQYATAQAALELAPPKRTAPKPRAQRGSKPRPCARKPAAR